MMVEPSFRRAAAIFLLAPAGQCRQHGVLQAGLLAHPACDLVAIHPRHSDVKEHYGRWRVLRHLQRRRAAEGYPNVVALHPEQHGEAIGGVLIVVNHQEPMARRCGRLRLLFNLPPIILSKSVRRDRESHNEFAAFPQPAAAGRRVAALSGQNPL